MTSYAFFFDEGSFNRARQASRSGTPVPIDFVGAAEGRPFTQIRPGDELFIVGLKNHKVHLAGRMIAATNFIPREEAARTLSPDDLIDKPLICIADRNHLDFMRPDLTVPAEIARELGLSKSDGEELKLESLRLGRPDPNLFRRCPSLSDRSATALRLLLDLRESRTQGNGDAEEEDVQPGKVDDEDYRTQAIKTRRGQRAFRENVMRVYGGKCVVTACRIEALLEAAHITPHAEMTDYRACNGLLLRSDIHTLFDEGLLTVDERYAVRVSPIRRESEYWTYNGRALHRLPDRSADQPDREALRLRVSLMKL